jgi:hypothetical protein
VRRAAAVDVDLDVRVLLDDRSDGAGVIEVDVRHQDLADVLEANPFPRQRSGQVRQRRGRAGIDQRHAGGSVQDRRGDDLRPPEEREIDVVEA